jgi:hypothetical protein
VGLTKACLSSSPCTLQGVRPLISSHARVGIQICAHMHPSVTLGLGIRVIARRKGSLYRPTMACRGAFTCRTQPFMSSKNVKGPQSQHKSRQNAPGSECSHSHLCAAFVALVSFGALSCMKTHLSIYKRRHIYQKSTKNSEKHDQQRGYKISLSIHFANWPFLSIH